ncbi:MAG: hypothetical protein LBJ14_05460 [Desulfarculales bacterium]|jgi:hypothetical protein|nr:hypothetical protein [Desulfarculales bacterium]
MLNEVQEALNQPPPIVSEPEAQETLYEVIGINLEELRQRLKDVHDIGLSQDDPILMMATIFNVCLAEQEKVFEKHQAAITRYLGHTTDQYTEEITAAISGLNNAFRQISSDTVSGAFAKHAEALGQFRASLWWPISVAVISALINIAVLLIMRFGHG